MKPKRIFERKLDAIGFYLVVIVAVFELRNIDAVHKNMAGIRLVEMLKQCDNARFPCTRRLKN
jgi:hypothetical protein